MYTPLDPAREEIRLLEIRSGSYEDDLTIDLHVSDYFSGPGRCDLTRYTELSYVVWGPRDKRWSSISVGPLDRSRLYSSSYSLRSSMDRENSTQSKVHHLLGASAFRLWRLRSSDTLFGVCLIFGLDTLQFVPPRLRSILRLSLMYRLVAMMT